LGTAIFLVIVVILVSFTELHIERNPNPWDPWSAFWFLSIIPLALMEEIAFRAYPFIKLNRGFGLRIAQLLVSIAFASYHIINGWDIQIAFLGPATWAFVFGLSAIWSNGIAVPTGVHVALNLIQELLGMRGNEGSIWLFKRAEDIPATVNSAETVGIIIQVLVLLSAVVATELYLRGGKRNHR
jgi:membrane protease YdiL (CAAX protease family)